MAITFVQRILTCCAMAVGAVVLGIAWTGSVIAAVPADIAERLDQDLTPLGSERAGNADGTIPAWTGGAVICACRHCVSGRNAPSRSFRG